MSGHPLGSYEVRLLRDLVQAYLDHGEWNEAARADFETAINREQARLDGDHPTAAHNAEEDRQWLDDVYDRAGLSHQERRVIELAAMGWTVQQMQREMTPQRRRRPGWDLPIETIDRYLRSARSKLRSVLAPTAELVGG